MKKNTKKVAYAEPADYFPKEIRKQFKLGEYADTKKTSATPKKKTVKRK